MSCLAKPAARIVYCKTEPKITKPSLAARTERCVIFSRFRSLALFISYCLLHFAIIYIVGSNTKVLHCIAVGGYKGQIEREPRDMSSLGYSIR